MVKSLFRHFRQSTHWFWAAARFGFSGALSALLFLGVYKMVLYAAAGFIGAAWLTQLATFCGLSFSLTLVFFVNKYFTFFSGGSGRTGRELVWFLLGRIVSNSLIYLPGMHLLVHVAGVRWYLAVVLITIPSSVFNFLFERHITFAAPKAGPGRGAQFKVR